MPVCKMAYTDRPAQSSRAQGFSIATSASAGGGHYNHSMFWKIMGKETDNNGPSSELKAAIGGLQCLSPCR